MKWSCLFVPTTREVPAEAEIVSHRLMIRAGLIRKLASGTYSYLPLGFRCLTKAINIVRQEMDAAGGQEVLLPALQPLELWEKSGRDVAFGENLMRVEDRHGRSNVLGPTHEEVMTEIAANHLSSYKQLPVCFYQIQTKFRDEFRPRFGVLRSREFLRRCSEARRRFSVCRWEARSRGRSPGCGVERFRVPFRRRRFRSGWRSTCS